PRSDVVTSLPREREDQNAVDVIHDRADEARGDVSRRGLTDPRVEFVELASGFGGVLEVAHHERAAHVASNSAQTSSAGIARDGSALIASYAAAASVRSHVSDAMSKASSGSTDSSSRRATCLRTSGRRDIPAS